MDRTAGSRDERGWHCHRQVPRAGAPRFSWQCQLAYAAGRVVLSTPSHRKEAMLGRCAHCALCCFLDESGSEFAAPHRSRGCPFMRLSARLPADRQHRVALSQGGSYSVNTPVGNEESAHESQVCERVSHTIRSSSIVCSGTSIASPLSRCLNSDSDRSVHAIDSLRRTSSSQSPRHAEQSADGRADSDHRASPTGQSAPNATLACASKSWSECTSCTSSGRAPLHIPSINHSQRATGALQTTPYAPNRRATQLRAKANERSALLWDRFDSIR